MKRLELTGQRFGSLVVVGDDTTNRGYVLTRCDCGTTGSRLRGALTSGRSQSCGCSRSPDLVGQTFARLTVVERLGPRRDDRSVHWRCRCTCGQTSEVRTYALRLGIVKSCGCLRDERVRESLARRRGAGGRAQSERRAA